MKQNYTKSANNALKYAKKVALQLKQEYVGSEHLLLGLMKEKNGIAYAVLTKNGVDEERLENLTSQLMMDHTNVALVDKADYSKRCQDILDLADKEATKFKAKQVGTEHLLIAIIKHPDSVAFRLLTAMNIAIPKMYGEILTAMWTSSGQIPCSFSREYTLSDISEQIFFCNSLFTSPENPM